MQFWFLEAGTWSDAVICGFYKDMTNSESLFQLYVMPISDAIVAPTQ